ncbi:MAG: NADH-quinone oxidoreductase subunit N [bacterium]
MDAIIPVTTQDLSLIYPQIALAVFIVAVLLLDLLVSSEDKVQTAVFSFVSVVIAGYFSWRLWGASATAFGGMLIVDNFSLFFNLIFLSACGLTVLMSVRYLKAEEINLGEYYVLLLVATLGMMIMAAAGNLLIVFLGIETLSISLYVLAGMNRKRMVSGEAALKYLLLGAFATGFLLYGMALIYGATGTIDLKELAQRLAGAEETEPLLLVGMVLMMAGFAFKASLVPFHFWAPDVYQGAPTPATAFMATGGKAAAFAVFFRVFTTALPELQAHWGPVLWALAILTMTVANVTALWQENVKRMLAYSSVAHAGYLLIAVLAGGEWGRASLIFYLAAYTLMNIGAFGVLTALSRKGNANETLDDIRGLGFRRPALAAAMALFMLSLGGIPPTAGFLAKLYVFAAGVREGLLPLVIIAVVNAVISIYYYLRVVVFMYMREPENGLEAEPPSLFETAGLLICAAGVLALGIFPGLILNIVNGAILW